jgi:nucleotide-binding universal stress UspA family protein
MSAHRLTRILVGFDASDAAARAVRMAQAICGAAGAEVCVVAVTPPAKPVETAADQAASDQALRDRLDSALRRAVDGTPPRLEFVAGHDVSKALSDYVAEHGYELLVVGSRGVDGGLGRGLGHVAQHLVRAQREPVLVVPVT